MLLRDLKRWEERNDFGFGKIKFINDFDKSYISGMVGMKFVLVEVEKRMMEIMSIDNFLKSVKGNRNGVIVGGGCGVVLG